MKRFVILFSVISPTLFLLLYFPFSPLYTLNSMQTAMTDSTLQKILLWFSVPAAHEGGTVIFQNGSFLTVTDACNAMAAYLMFAAALLSFPVRLGTKIRWLVSGYIAITAANMLRLFGVSVAMHLDPHAYGWAHDIAGRYGFGLFVLLLYAAFVTYGRSRNSSIKASS